MIMTSADKSVAALADLVADTCFVHDSVQVRVNQSYEKSSSSVDVGFSSLITGIISRYIVG